MDNKKDDLYFVRKIIENIDFILTNTADLALDELIINDILIDSIMFRFIQISENVKKLTDEFKTAKSNIPWNQISGIRNKIVHAYDTIKVDVVYQTIKYDLPYLRNALMR